MLHAKSSAFGAAKIAATSNWTKLKHRHRADRLRLRRLDKLRCQRKCVYRFRCPFGLFVQKLSIWFRTWNLSRQAQGWYHATILSQETKFWRKKRSYQVHCMMPNQIKYIIVNNSAVFEIAHLCWSHLLRIIVVNVRPRLFFWQLVQRPSESGLGTSAQSPIHCEAKTLSVHFHQGTPARGLPRSRDRSTSNSMEHQNSKVFGHQHKERTLALKGLWKPWSHAASGSVNV